jgi:hypothetical protein
VLGPWRDPPGKHLPLLRSDSLYAAPSDSGLTTLPYLLELSVGVDRGGMGLEDIVPHDPRLRVAVARIALGAVRAPSRRGQLGVRVPWGVGAWSSLA